MRTVVIMGAGGRDFHNFNTVFRNDPDTRVVAFTATQIPGIAGRTYPAALAGSDYPDGIPIRPEGELAGIIGDHHVDEVVLAYSDLSHEEVMHKASAVLAAGADFRLLGPRATMLRSARPVVAVSAVRTGAGKSQTSRRVGRILLAAGLRVALVRHPMPYGDLERMRIQRFATLADIDASNPTIEEREEYEEPVRQGMVMYAGVDYREILSRAEHEADVIVWDGGNNDFPFFAPDLHITVADPLRAGHELRYHPGETNLRMADVVVINKIDSAEPAAVAAVAANVAATNPAATVIRAASPVTLEPGPSLAGARVLVVEDGPTLTHGGMPYGAGTVAARQAGATSFVDPRPSAVGSIAETFRAYPSIGLVLPAMGYSQHQIEELRASIDAADCDVVVAGTPIGLRRIVGTARPVRQARYELRELGRPDLADVLAPILATARPGRPLPAVERGEDDVWTLHPQIQENLLRAMRREAYAFAMCLLYATQARKHGRPQLADLFEQVANQEYFGHFADQAQEAGVIGMEAENLHLAIEEEAFEAEVMYRDFQAQAEAVGDHDAAERFRRLREDERRNRDQFLAVLRDLDPADPAE